MDSKDRLCDAVARIGFIRSSEVVRMRHYMRTGPRNQRELWDKQSARAEQRMIEQANKLIELRSN